MSDSQIRIRPAVPADEPLAISLIHRSMGEEMDWLFGQEAGHPAEVVIGGLFERRGNRFSREFCWVAEADGQAAGLLLAYPGRGLPRMEAITALHLARIFGLAATVRVALRQRAYGDLVEAKKDEFYLSNLGVLPEFQGRGIGSSMLIFADSLARATGLGKCSLLVTQDNPACRLYERHAYRVVASYVSGHAAIAHGGGFHRMVKIVPPPVEPDVHA